MKLLIENGLLVSMHPGQTDGVADLLIEDDRVAQIAPPGQLRLALGSAAVERIDARDRIVVPGFINAHMHTWQTALRGLASNWSLLEYFRKMHAGLATVFKPDDLYIATLMGALNQINCGTTTLVDWCHNNPSPEHNDAALDALGHSGIRAAFFHGTPKPDPKPGEPGFWEIPHPRGEVERLLKRQRNELISIGAAILGPHYSTLEVALHDFRMARELGLIASMHQGGGAARTPEGWIKLEQAGLLGPQVNIVHGHSLSDDQLQRFCELDMSFSVTPENEMAQGHGHPIVGRLRQFNTQPSLGVDLESVLGGEMFVVARMALASQRALDNADYRSTHGTIAPTCSITVREALGWITLDGARMLRQEHRIGSLAAGKQADLVLIRADQLNMQPIHDPAATVLMQTSLANIDSVMVAGRWRKRDGVLLEADLASKLANLNASGRRIVSAMGLN